MKITVFTSNQPRHIALIEALGGIADRIYAVQECNTVFPGQVADFFAKSDVMQRYFSQVIAAERALFGSPRFPRSARCSIRQMAIKMGDLSLLSPDDLGDAMDADLFIVFGASYIRGELCRRLVDRRAINIHMGISPQYRGSSCNFWALYDGNPHLVGATLHLLSSTLDAGPIIRHALPTAGISDGFALGMAAVASAHQALIEHIREAVGGTVNTVPQDRRLEIRYTRNSDFTDAIVAEYLDRLPTQRLERSLAGRQLGQFERPFVPSRVRSAA